MYETFEHTADLGLRIPGPGPGHAVRRGGPALFSAIVEDLAAVQPKQRIDLSHCRGTTGSICCSTG